VKILKNNKLLLIVVIAGTLSFCGWKYCHAAPTDCKPAPKPCTHCQTHPCKSSDSVWEQLAQGFALTGGFRWDQECAEATPCRPSTPVDLTGHHDPAFIGAELRLPLASWATAGGNFDRDWTDAPDWNARVYVAFAPWRRPKQSR
jgi:hypothetical protein